MRVPPLLSARVTQVSVDTPLGAAEQAELKKLAVALPDSLKNAIAKRRDEYLAGRYCAALALSQAGAGPSGEIETREDGSPDWPRGWVGSITHARGLAAAAVARASEVRSLGIDSEQVMSETSAQNLASRLLTGGEPGLRPADWSAGEWVTLIFSAKEAIYKCLRPLCGKFFGFADAEIFETDARGVFRFRLTRAIGGEFEAGWTGEGRFAREPGWVHAAMELGAAQAG